MFSQMIGQQVLHEESFSADRAPKTRAGVCFDVPPETARVRVEFVTYITA